MDKEKKREYMKKYYQANKEKIKEKTKEWYQANKEKTKEWQKSNKESLLEYQKEYYQANKERILEYHKEYQKNNREKHLGQMKKYMQQTPMGRASNLISAYNQSDKMYNRGQGDLTAQWIVESIFTKPCHYCGKEGWKVIGCDRIDNSLPHTEDNVVPCCEECNTKRGNKTYEEFLADN